MVLDGAKFDVWIMSPGVYLHAKASLSAVSAIGTGKIQNSACFPWTPSLAILSTPRQMREAFLLSEGCMPCTKPEWASIRPHFSGQALLFPLLMLRLHPDFPRKGSEGTCPGLRVAHDGKQASFLKMQRSEQFSPMVPVDRKVSRETTIKQQLPMIKHIRAKQGRWDSSRKDIPGCIISEKLIDSLGVPNLWLHSNLSPDRQVNISVLSKVLLHEFGWLKAPQKSL